MNGGHYGSFSRGGSSLSGISPNSKTAEAQLLSQATSTAMVAARSILMSGGSEEVALKTAKAAAESVLNPSASDTDTISGRSTTFLRRRKAKRQAEVVASMALTTATINMRTGFSSDWSESNQGSHLNPFARNITTQSMHTQDEPSVLSGSTRPPKPPTPRAESHKSTQSRNLESKKVIAAEKNSPPAGSPSVPPLSPRYSNARHTSPGVTAILTGSPSSVSGKAQPKAQTTPERKTPTSSKAPKSPGNHPSRNFEMKPTALQDPIYSISSSEAEETETHGEGRSRNLSASHDDEFDDEATAEGSTWEEPRKNPWKDFDPLMNTFTSAFNMLSCGPFSSLGTEQEGGGGGCSRLGGTSRNAADETVFSAEGTADERDDNGTDFRSMDSYDQSDMKDRSLDSNSSDDCSVDSSSLLRELQSSSSSEGEIQVRSSIRDTMEKIVSKSKKRAKGDRKKRSDKKWQSYELQDECTTSTSAKSKKSSQSTQSKKPFFFNRRSTKKQSSAY